DKLDGCQRERRIRDHFLKKERVFGSPERSDKAAARRGGRKRVEVRARDDGESAERTDQEFVQVVAGDVLHHAAATLAEFAGTIDEFSADEEVARSAVGMAQPGIHAGSDDAANGGFEIKRDRKRQELLLIVERHGKFIEIGAGVDAEREV